MLNGRRRFAVYVRVRVSGQEAISECACLKSAEELGGTAHSGDVYRDFSSGASLERLELNRLRQLVASGEVEAVLVYSLDRLSRDRVALCDVVREFGEHGVGVYPVKGRFKFKGVWDVQSVRLFVKKWTRVYWDWKSRIRIKEGVMKIASLGHRWPGSKESELRDIELREVAAGFSERNRAMVSVRTRRGKEAAALRGLMPCGVGLGICGYDYSPELRCRVVNEDEAVVVLRIFREFADGRTRYAIARQLNADGVPSKRGGSWGYAVLTNMLGNESYVGVDYYGKTRTIRGSDGIPKKVWVPRRDWIEIRGFTPPLVPELVFYRAQERLRNEVG